ESIPNTGIKLLCGRPETEAALSRQLDIPHRFELLRRSAELPPAPIKDAPVFSADTHFLQDVVLVGQTSTGQNVYLVLSVVLDQPQWAGGWWLAVVPVSEETPFTEYLVQARDCVIAGLRSEQEQT